MVGLLTRIAEVTGSCTVNGQPASCGAAAGITAGIFGVLFFIIILPILVVVIASMWRLFTKAGKPGWASIVPIYNIYILLQIIGRPTWWLLLFLLCVIPFVGSVVAIVLGIVIALDTAKSFGEEIGMGLLLFFLPIIGYPILAFGKSKYVGPAAKKAAPAASTPPPTAPQTPPASSPPSSTDTPAPTPPPQTPVQPPAPPTNPVQ